MGQDTLELFFQEGKQQPTMGDMVGVLLFERTPF